ncbi:GIY-YIG nuclease family protein [Cocleimonas sp. KMM 6892]|uniref:GIY-YIG nuclease family protein n=1 Tax=unclassified Cocleimonas TaxID=2639732 RepID=UPI002DBB1132|nr:MULTISPECIES: GIY-YIG nuclease family protein [unclassified Cocleimonas]MEB8430627.1 GIY-YIG nuclease family protein [Cocleimonas sp. KMM 6892]MEC4716922.1 GIY-YIG nuclease family protein [Cocleimonas sp. KMM 6895]MEC4743934.1 GIY-YIG nuclease family protein [Cocleimonas sp. KMM 6896]
MQAATIKLFLVHGSPNGLRTAELSNWSGKAVAAPRTEIPELLKREELSSPGFYLLTGVDPESGDRAIYIGEAENVAIRLKGHASKDFWNSVTVFVSKDENLTKAHIRYLEGILIVKANNNGNAVVMNAASSGARLPESDAAEMDVFLEKCLQLMPVLGVSDFNEKLDQASESNELLYCKIKGLVATGKRTANGFIVFAGSQAVLEHRPSAKNMRAKREHLIDKDLLVPNGDHLIFTKDVEFGSPSTAGSVVRGGNTNGLTYWRNSNGVQLKEIEANET